MMISFLHPNAEANRDIMDWSGKKPLDYQKQMTNMSASFTFNSEYKGLHTMPARMHVVEKPNRSKVQRSYSAMLDESLRSFFDTNSSTARNKHEDTMSLAGGLAISTANDFGTGSRRKSKRDPRASFLKKSIRRK
jgi:hypothetical protein